jgi:hypothetical protein
MPREANMYMITGRRHGRTLAGILVAGSLAFGVAACGDDEEDSSSAEESASTEEVTVTATEYEFDLSATPSAETKSVVFDNQGEDFHVMIFARINEGFTVEEAIEAQGREGTAEMIAQAEAAPGESTTAEVKADIEPGSYAMLCPIEDKEGAHYELGQLEEFDIE